MPMSAYMRELRARMGHSRLLMPSVAGVVRAPGGRVLLVQQVDDGSWSTPGGAMDPEDQCPADAVVREVWEETSLLVVPTRVIAVLGGPNFVVRYPNGDETQYAGTVFECEVQSGELHADGDEVVAAKYWTLEESLRLPLSPWLNKVLPRLYEPAAALWFAPASWRPPSV